MSYTSCRVDWSVAEQLLRDVREKVFVCEWRIPQKVEFDRKDRQAYHILVCDDISQEPIATGRILPSGEISRIAVLMGHREQQVTELILKELKQIASELELKEVFISCPLHHVEHFTQLQFIPNGAVFMEAGIAMQQISCQLANLPQADYCLSH